MSDIKKNYPQTRVLSGFMELIPQEQIEFDKIKETILNTYASFGFTAIDTPVMERLDILRAKNVGETENSTLIYEIDRESKQREAGLRFDLTVPLARYVSEHFNDLTFPFRRCHLAKVYRRERAQKGRFREFYQCDIDVVGHQSLSIKYDAEIPSIIYQLFKRLKFGKFTIRINNRKLLNGLMESFNCNVVPEMILAVIDRKEKVTHDAFTGQLKAIGLEDTIIDAVHTFCDISGTNDDVLQQLKGLNIKNENFTAGLNELAMVVEYMKALQVDEAYYQIDPVIVRGLDYYTGTVYETVLDDYPELGAVCSGGRYDNLAEAYTKEKLPGVGISIGLTRLFDQLKEIGLIKSTCKTAADVIIIPKEESDIVSALHISRLLREKSFNVDVLLEDCNYKKKINYVTRKDTRFTILVDGNDNGLVTLQFKNADGTINKQKITADEVAAKMIK